MTIFTIDVWGQGVRQSLISLRIYGNLYLRSGINKFKGMKWKRDKR